MDIQIIIAILLAYIAWQNYRINEAGFYINKDKLRLDLFDRRYKVFEGFRSFFTSFSLLADIKSDELSKLIWDTADAEFLFGKEVSEYRQKVIDKCVRLKQLNGKFQRGVMDEKIRAELAQEAADLEEWIANQNEELRKLFRKYLHFSIDATPK
ncbi:MAG: hypothetical protein WC887_00240 [Candidatus Paceibacterota bacterium]|jgi:hypothetical protein